jgi:hypothetical protein
LVTAIGDQREFSAEPIGEWQLTKWRRLIEE